MTQEASSWETVRAANADASTNAIATATTGPKPNVTSCRAERRALSHQLHRRHTDIFGKHRASDC